MSPPSPALQQKIATARARAPHELPLIRDAARVVLAAVSGNGELDAAVATLKANHGANWSMTTALQVLSGRRGQFAAECGKDEERAELFLAHLIAETVCNKAGMVAGAVSMPTAEEIAELQDRAQAWRAHSSEPPAE